MRISIRSLFIFILSISAALTAQDWHAGRIQQEINRLDVLSSTLYIGAHPDDENTAVLSYLSNERLVRTAYLSLTRGDGGQNLIGSEKGDLLGIIRTQELLAARRLDHSQQFFSNAVDFGYSKTPEESLQFWGEKETLADLVWVIRKFRPDVLITRFTPQFGGHGHHRASAILAGRAFTAAADPRMFPEQLKYVSVWQPKRLLWNAWRLPDSETRPVLKLEIGNFNPLLGLSNMEISARSRSMHKSQGFGASARRGSRIEKFRHTAGDPAGLDLFDGIIADWSRVSSSTSISALVHEIQASFDAAHPWTITRQLEKLHRKVSQLQDIFWRDIKLKAIEDLILACNWIRLFALLEKFAVAREDEAQITLKILQSNGMPLQIESVHFPYAATDTVVSFRLQHNQPFEFSRKIVIPADAPLTQPYWLENKKDFARFRIAGLQDTGLPEKENFQPLLVTFKGETVSFERQIPVRFHWTDPVHGEMYRKIEITPDVLINSAQPLVLFNGNEAKTVKLTITVAKDGFSGTVLLKPSPGWKTDPEKFQIENAAAGQTLVQPVMITPAGNPETGKLQAVLSAEKSVNLKNIVRIEHEHIPMQTHFPDFELKLVNPGAKSISGKIGYIKGSGDEIPSILQQIGYTVEFLDDDEILQSDLSQYDAVIAGVRAYNTRTALANSHAVLMQYVQNGGTYLVQYNVSRQLAVDPPGPYPFKITRARVTQEDAPVTLLDSSHPLFQFPYRIGEKDFEGWVQERGLYFASDWDRRYRTLLACHDTGEAVQEGGLLIAPYGKGVYIYSGYSWFRQLPAGVPGAIRLFVNLISLRGDEFGSNHTETSHGK